MMIRATNAIDARAAPGARIYRPGLSGLSAILAAVALAFTTPMADRAKLVAGLDPGVAAVSDEALPGEGRPPSPGPTEPNELVG
jgi:hypothetical protein